MAAGIFCFIKKGGKIMDSSSKKFERNWLLIFLFMYVLVMIPFSFFYSNTYIPSVAGIPSFIIGWFVHTAITFVLIFLYFKQAMERKEYHEFDDEQEGGK